MPTSRIAVVEDEEALVEVLDYHLEHAGFDVSTYLTGEAAWDGIVAAPPDGVLLDLMLPDFDGLELLRLMKRRRETEAIPVLILTAKGEETDRIVGLELGADDYITKPFSPREVVLRVKAVLRRTESSPHGRGRWLTAGELRVDPEGHRAFLGDEELELTALEFRLLETLVERRGRVQSRRRLLKDVWGYAEDVHSRTVDTHIRRLREKLGSTSELIETVVGVGYRLRAPA